MAPFGVLDRGTLAFLRKGVGLLALLFFLLIGCGGNKRKIPPLVVPAAENQPADAGPSIHRARIRIMLVENFTSHEIRGDERADRLQIRAEEGKVSLYEVTDGRLDLLGKGSGFRFSNTREIPLELDGARYRGFIDAFINPLGVPVIVNDLPIEAYLRSVVPNELGPFTFPVLETLKAQAVAARTFAVAGLGTWVKHGYDLFADSRSQKYTGVAEEHELSDRAIESTDGVVATFAGEPILALYSSTCGGVTESFENIFKGGPIPYLKGGIPCNDRASPYHHWREEIRLADIRGRLENYLDSSRLCELVPLHYSRAGRVIEMKFVSKDWERILRGNDIRFALGLRSNFILQLESELDEEGMIDTAIITGKGWGHGVGLCQLGAVQLGREGKSYEKILTHYYSGISLQKWY